ncbi:MAG: ParA family protein [Acidimicrobiales bacterium]
MIANSILVLNGKGGVGKTSLTANLAGLAALTGWRVLAVDLDPQGNLGRDLGYLADADDGGSLATATAQGSRPEPLRDVRPGLDVLAGGPALDGLVADLQRALLGGDLAAADRLGLALGAVAIDYDLVVIDSPPGEALLHAAAIRAVHYIVIPTRADAASIDGLGRVAAVVAREGAANPGLEVLGVVLGPLPRGARAIARQTRVELEALLGERIIVFDTIIRDVPRAAVDCRGRGVLAHEYEQEALKAPRWWERKARPDGGEGFSDAAAGLASDYQELVREILARFSARQAVAVTAGEI